MAITTATTTITAIAATPPSDMRATRAPWRGAATGGVAGALIGHGLVGGLVGAGVGAVAGHAIAKSTVHC